MKTHPPTHGYRLYLGSASFAGLLLVQEEGHSDGAGEGFASSVVQCSGEFHLAARANVAPLQ
jgi:hypothetical protein